MYQKCHMERAQPPPPIAKPKLANEDVIRALVTARGMITQAARLLDVSPQTVRRYVDRNKAIKAAVADERSKLIDLAELGLVAAVGARQPWAITFTLTTLAKDRGYERKSVPGSSPDDPLYVEEAPKKAYSGFDPKEV